MPESIFAQAQTTTDETIKTNIAEMQLRREKELSEGHDEKKRLQIITQTVSKIIQDDLQHIMKNKSISDDEKKQLLSLKNNL